MISRLLLTLALLFPQGPTTVSPKTTVFPGTTVSGGTLSTSAPTFVSSVSFDGFTTPVSSSIGTLNSGDIVWYFVITTQNAQTFTMTVTGTCASTGGNVTETGPTGQGAASSSAQMGHLVLTTGGACSLSVAWTGAASMNVTVIVIRGSSGVDVNSTINNQNGPGTTANAVTSGTAITTTGANRLCVGGTSNPSGSAGSITAGTSPTVWTFASSIVGNPTGSEYATVVSSGSVQATFTYANNPFSQTAVSCFKP